MDISKLQTEKPSKAELKSQALEKGQALAVAAAGPALAQYGKYIGMFNQMVSIVDKVQQFRAAPRATVLKHSLSDTMNPKGTAVAIALETATQAEKTMSSTLIGEFASKALKVL